MASLEFRTSNYSTFQAADAAAALVPGGVVYVDSVCLMPSSYAMLASAIKFGGGILRITGSGNVVLAQDISVPAYANCFNLTSTGLIRFKGATTVNPVWWGADGQGNIGSVLATYGAFQNAVLSIDGFPGGVVEVPAGYYILDVTNGVSFRTNSWKRHSQSAPRSVRIDFDPSTVQVNTKSGGQLAIFATCHGPAGNHGLAGSYLTNSPRIYTDNVPTPAQMGAIDPASTCNGLVWSGIDIVSGTWSGSSLGANKWLHGIMWAFVQNGLIEDSCFIGLPNDGLMILGGYGTVRGCYGWLNGHTGDSAPTVPASRNGIDSVGWWDLQNPELTTHGWRFIDCDVRSNVADGFQGGSIDMDFQLVGGICSGNANGFEGYGPINCTIWTPNTNIPAYQCLYAGNNVYYYGANSGTTGSTPPTVTQLNTPFTDGTINSVYYVGSMPEDSLIPTNALIKDLVIDGAVPSQLEMPYLGTQSIPPNPLTSTYQGYYGGSFHGGNEGRLRIRNLLVRNVGVSTDAGSNGFIFTQQNGGILDVDGMAFEQCTSYNTGGARWWLGCQLNTAVTGSPTNYFGPPAILQQQARVTIKNVHQRNCSGMVSYTSAVVNVCPYVGCVSYFDISGVTSDGSNPGGSLVNVTMCYPTLANFTLEEGRIQDCYSAQNNIYAIGVNTRATDTIVTNGITLARNKLFNANSNSGQTYYGAISFGFASAANTFQGEFRMYENETSFGADTDFPISVSVGAVAPSAPQQPVLIVHHNRFDSNNTAWNTSIRLAFSNQAEPSIVSSPSAYFMRVDAFDDGLPGEAMYRNGASPPLNIPYWEGDISWRNYFSTNSTILDVCIVRGGFYGSGTMSSLTTSSTGNARGVRYLTYVSGTPPLVGEMIYFPPPLDSTIYEVRGVNTTTKQVYIYPALVAANVNNATVQYAPAPIFTTR